jgi:hypothetical protein
MRCGASSVAKPTSNGSGWLLSRTPDKCWLFMLVTEAVKARASCGIGFYALIVSGRLSIQMVWKPTRVCYLDHDIRSAPRDQVTPTLSNCHSPKFDPACIFNNFIRLLAVHTGDVVLQLRQSRSLLPTPAAALPLAQVHLWRAINGFVTGDNIRNNFSKCGADGFHGAQSCDPNTRDESNRLIFPRMDFATDSGRL